MKWERRWNEDGARERERERLAETKPSLFTTMSQEKRAREKAEEDEYAPPFRPPSSDPQLEEALGVPGVIYKRREGLLGIRVRKKRGRVYFETGLPLWVLTREQLFPIATQVRDVLSGRVSHTGFDIFPK
jgi:hypothetical protein